jgi:FtsP/CotA-like multicopper oxidase with cupredoxin domain
LRSILTRRQFASVPAIIVAGALFGGIVGACIARGRPEHFTRRLPLPHLIDAARHGNAIELKVASGKHSLVGGNPTRSYGYSGQVLGPTLRLRRGDEAELTVENALDVDATVH